MGIVTVVGIGAEGWAGLDSAAKAIVTSADAVVGGERHLAMLPPGDQRREPWPSPLRSQLVRFLGTFDGLVVALASGDPLVSGIGSTLIELLGEANVEIIPAVSSVALARARMKWPAESVEVISLVGRDPHTVLRGLAPEHRLLVLSGDGSTPAKVAQLLVDAGYGASAMTVLSDLGSPAEQRKDATAATWSAEAKALNVIAVECASTTAEAGSWTGGLPDEAFEHDGQLTKRDIRASALARLAPQPGQLLWDVGAGAASIAIEWMRAHPTCRSIAIEAREDRAKRSADNAARLGVPALRIVTGHAPVALDGLDRPHAIFIGGGATEPGVLEACWSALQTGGRLVVHGVTLETESVLARWYGEHGGELTRLHVEHAAPIGTFTGWNPTRAITQWSVVKGRVAK